MAEERLDRADVVWIHNTPKQRLARKPRVLYVPHMPKHPHTPTPDLIPTSEVAEMFGLHVATIVRRVQAGELPYAVKVPGKTGAYLFDRAEIEKLAKAS